MSTATASQVILNPLYDDQKLTLKATGGNNTFANSAHLYPGYLDSDFENWNLDGPGKPSPENEIGMKEMTPGSNGNFAEIFAAIGDIGSLLLPQEQALNFGVEHEDKLHPDGWATFIPFTRNDELPAKDLSNVFVALVLRGGGERLARVDEFSDRHAWHGGRQPRVVFRKQQ